MEIQRPDKPRAVKTHIRKAAPVNEQKTATPAQGRGERAAKTAAAREAAAKRNAERYTKPVAEPTSAKPEKGTRAAKVQASRDAAQSRRSGAKKPTARRTLSPEAKEQSRQSINRKVITQTPSQREEARRAKKLGGSVKNIEVKHHTKTGKQKFYVKKKNEGIGKLLLSRLILFLIMFALLFGMVAGIFAMSLHSGGSGKGKEYTLQVGADIDENEDKEIPEEQKPTYTTIPGKCSTRNGNLYIPVSALSDACALTVTGNVNDLRYIPRGSENQSIRFIVDTDIAYVNGAKIRMISPSFISEGKLYVPLDFMLKYSKGLVINVDDAARKITVARYVEGYDAATDSDVYAPLTFNLSKTEALTSIPEDSVQG